MFVLSVVFSVVETVVLWESTVPIAPSVVGGSLVERVVGEEESGAEVMLALEEDGVASGVAVCSGSVEGDGDDEDEDGWVMGS